MIVAPKKIGHHSGMLRMMSATRSPFFTPILVSASAMASAARVNVSNVARSSS